MEWRVGAVPGAGGGRLRRVLLLGGLAEEFAAIGVEEMTQQELQKIIYKFGEEKFAPRIASAIVRQRQIKPIETTLELADIIKSAIPAAARREGGHPARRTFQALRIYVNGELDGLSQALLDMFECLNDLIEKLLFFRFHQSIFAQF